MANVMKCSFGNIHSIKYFAILLLALCIPLWTASAEELSFENSWCNDLAAPTRIAMDPATDLLYVTSPRSSEIAVYDTLGTLLNTITTVGHPEAITADGLGNLFVVSGNTIKKLDTDGNVLMTIGDSEEYFVSPNDVAVGPDGRIYVACVTDGILVSDSIRVFDAAGNPLGGFGGFGRWYGHLNVPVALAIDAAAGELYVIDQNYDRVMVFDLDGQGLREWGIRGNGNQQPSEFLRVWGCDFDESGRLWTFDAILNTFQVFSPAGVFQDMLYVNDPDLRTGYDFVVRGTHVYLVSQATQCVLVYSIVPAVATGRIRMPAEPRGLTVRRSGNDIILDWDSVPDAAGYRVIRSAHSEISLDDLEDLGIVEGLTFTDQDALARWDIRFYQVFPVDENGNLLTDPIPAPESLAFIELTRGTSRHERPHREWDGVSCRSCHFTAYDYPDPLPDWWFGDHLCKSCHVETGMAQPQQNHFTSADTIYCQTCHDQHQHQPQFPRYFIRDVISTPNSGDQLLAFNSAADFVHGAPDYDGICEVCHTQTSYYRNNESGNHTHNTGMVCTDCHKHIDGFRPDLSAGGSGCLGCHSSPIGSRRAIDPDFTSPNGHHPLTYNESGDLSTPQDNNCMICHLEGSDPLNYHADGDVDLNPDPDNSGDSEWRYAPTTRDSLADLDPDDTPSWWCMDCHDASNPDENYRLGGQVASDKSDFWVVSNHHEGGGNDGFIFSGIGCKNCHSNGHTQEQVFFSVFYGDSKEENNCFGCHGGSTLVRGPGNVTLESIQNAFSDFTREVAPKSKHSSEWNIQTDDGHTICRDCHDPHQLQFANKLCDPDNPSELWFGSMDDFCLACHDGTQSGVPVHAGVTITTEACSDCHEPHASTLSHLGKLDISARTNAVSPDPAVIPLGGNEDFDNIVTPAYTSLTQTVVDNMTKWAIVAATGGSVGTEFAITDSIPLDRSIGYEPNIYWGYYGRITVTSEMVINDDITIDDLNVFADVPHHYRGDMVLILEHVDTGTSVLVQASDWNDGASNLIFWYDSESPNPPNGDLSPRSTAESLTAFNGESALGTWRMTFQDTWPDDNPTDPLDPAFCWVRGWAVSVNSGILGSFAESGQFTATYEGSGNVYATLHEGPIYPNVQGGLYVSVWETTPLQSIGSVTVGPVAIAAQNPDPAWEPALSALSLSPMLRGGGSLDDDPSPDDGHDVNSGRSCGECHVPHGNAP